MTEAMIFVEGVADKKFIEDILKHLNYSLKDSIKIQQTGGKDGIEEGAIITTLQRITFSGGINYIIFDADDDYVKRKKEIDDALKGKDIKYEVFLFPNNKDAGNLETLLSELTLTEHQSILDCFEAYQDCINKSSKDYRVPILKTKIYAYVDTLLTKKEAKDGMAQETKRNYLNPNHWDLDVPALQPLKDFLFAIT